MKYGGKFWGLVALAIIVVVAGLAILHLRENRVATLTVDGGPRNGEVYYFLNQVAEVVERHSDILRLKVTSSKFNETSEVNAFPNGADLTTILSHKPSVKDTELVASLYEEVFQLITLRDTGIRRVEDLEGKRLALPLDGSAELGFFWSMAEHYNVYTQNTRWTTMVERDAIHALLKRDVDAIFFVGTKRNPATLKLVEEHGLTANIADLRMIEVDQAPAMEIKRPYLNSLEFKKGTFDGTPAFPHRDMKTAALTRYLVARSSADPAMIRELARVLFENRSDLMVRFPLANRISEPDPQAGTGLPLHEGAEAYYRRDEPSFVVENAEPLALLATVIAMLTSGLFAIRSRFVATQKNRADELNYRVLALGKTVKEVQAETALQECQSEMRKLLKEAVVALDTDDVTDAGFQSFAFLWEVVWRDLEDRLDSLHVSNSS